jgi:hypothetical protein
VYYFPGQVGQGKIKWEDAAAHALLRDKVLGNWPKDEEGWPKTLSKEDEAAYVGGLIAEERHAVSGLGGSQKAEVAWLDHHNIPYKEVDVDDFIDEAPTVAPLEKPSAKTGQKAAAVHPIYEEGGDETTEAVNLVELSAEMATDAMATSRASNTATLSEMAKEEEKEEEEEEVLTIVQEFSQGHEQQPEQEQHAHRVHKLQGQEQPKQEAGSKEANESLRRRSLAAVNTDPDL